MTYAHTLGLSQALRQIGVKGGAIPQLGGSLLPVVVLGDFSRSFSAEPFESRGFAASIFTVALGTNLRSWFRILSRGRGGIVVEDLRITQQGGGGFASHSFIDILPTASLPVATENLLNTVSGGNPALAPSSLVFLGETASAPSGAGPVDLSGFFLGLQPVGATGRWFVPPGFNMCIWSNNIAGGGNNIVCQASITWREIPEPIGAP